MLRKFIHLCSFARSLREVIRVREICLIRLLFLSPSCHSEKVSLVLVVVCLHLVWIVGLNIQGMGEYSVREWG